MLIIEGDVVGPVTRGDDAVSVFHVLGHEVVKGVLPGQEIKVSVTVEVKGRLGEAVARNLKDKDHVGVSGMGTLDEQGQGRIIAKEVLIQD